MPGPLDALREHHKAISAELEAMEAAMEGLTTSRVKEKADQVKHILHFLLEDLYPHAAAEERALYPPAEAIIKKHGKATAPYEQEHRTLEALLGEFKVSAEKLLAPSPSREGAAEALIALRKTARQIKYLVSSHLRKEEELILPLLEAHLSPKEQEGIVHKMHGQD